MPADLEEYQFELEDVVFGVDRDMGVVEGSFTPGGPDIRMKDAEYDSSDGGRPGRDYYGKSTWSWQFFADGATSTEALDMLEALKSVWPTEELRKQPNLLVPLRYNLGERTRRVYGRPRRWSPVVNNTLGHGTAGVAADFHVFDHRFYDDNEQSMAVPIVTTTRDSGVLVPFVPPFTSRRPAAPRLLKITVGGKVPTPFVTVIKGPVNRPRVRITGTPTPKPDGTPWRDSNGKTFEGLTIEIPSLVSANDEVTVDSHPWARTVTSSSGAGVRTNPRITKLDQLLLPPGSYQIAFTGEDPTGTSEATVKWRNAHLSL